MHPTEIPPEVKIYFPFPSVRAGQDIAISSIYQALKEERHIVIAAPNGFGKTITVLSAVLPLIKDSDEDLRIIYLCRTHVESQHVIEELNKIIKHLRASGFPINLGGISLRGRNSMCFHPQVMDQDPMTAQLLCRELRNLDRCDYELKLKENPGAVKNLLDKLASHAVDASELLEICRNWEFCPYQVSKLVLNRVHIIVCNYQWLFSPYIRDYFLESLDTSLDHVILIIDEAHNVPEVATEISSDQLTYFAVQQMMKEAESLDIPPIIDFGEHLLTTLDELKDKITDEMPISPQLTCKKVFQNFEMPAFGEQLIKLGENWQKMQLNQGKNPRSFLFSVGNFWINWYQKMNSKGYFFCATKYSTRGGAESVKLEIVSLDPKEILAPLLSKVYSSIHFSGTIEPIHYYTDIIGLPESTIELSLPSPFPTENVLALNLKGISTQGEKRNAETYKKYIKYCREAVENIPKNVGIFAASFEVLEGLSKNGIRNELKSTDKELFFEQKDMSSNENERMIAKFKSCAHGKGGILMGVCGGRNAEGEDFPGDLMNGVIICGVPFAKPTPRIKALIDYYGGSQKGKDYAYNMPAFRRANQAAGRPIRTITDRAVILLLDYRFTLPNYKKFLSSWFRNQIRMLPDEPGALAAAIRKFWG
ncbi:MAG: ATP-dependent DNA helicase [Candidatus Helarchaeota archaeon]|nr:ATP-dependent DNA helicase [Candidatus Helarchaeota archaeon]